MFLLSLLFIVLLCVLFIVWVDIPGVSGTNHEFGTIVIFLLIASWPLFWLEYHLSCVGDDRRLKPLRRRPSARQLACIVPPLRLAAASPAMHGDIWLPWLGWRQSDNRLYQELADFFSKPMLFVAMLIIPVLAIEIGLDTVVAEQLWLRILLHTVTGFIWCAFTIEFIVMISVTDQKIDYIKANWVDVAVILLPMVSFMRSWRILHTCRFVSLHSLVRMGRIYQIRGLLSRGTRTLSLFHLSNRSKALSPASRLIKLKREYAESLVKLEALREEINITECEISGFEDR